MTNTVRSSISASMPFLDQTLGAGVDRAGSLVQDHHRRVGDRRPGDGQQLALALRQVGAVGGDLGLVALRQAFDERMRIDLLGRLDAFLIGGIQPPVADVIQDRAGEQVRVLQHHAQRLAQVVLADALDVDAIVGDAALFDIVEAVEQVGDGGLAGAGRAHQGDLLPRFGIQRKTCAGPSFPAHNQN